MGKMKDKIDKIKDGTPSKWRENAKYRLENRWLEYSSEIARRILALIGKDKELNQVKLAEALEVSPQQISKIVQGRENLTLETIYKLSKALQFELITFPPYQYRQATPISFAFPITINVIFSDAVSQKESFLSTDSQQPFFFPESNFIKEIFKSSVQNIPIGQLELPIDFVNFSFYNPSNK